MGVAAVPAQAVSVTLTCDPSETVNGANLQAAVANPANDEVLLPDWCVFTLTSTSAPFDGLAPIARTLSIDTVSGSNTATIRRSPATGTPQFRLFDVITGGDLTLNNVTIQNGDVTSDNISGGGGILLQLGGTLTTNNIHVQGNTGSALAGAGGLALRSGTATLNGGSVTDNRAPTSGAGGIFNLTDTTLNDVRVSGNRAQDGGGILTSSGLLTVTDGTISNNTASASSGGLFRAAAARVVLDGTSVTDNRVTSGSGGGIRSGAASPSSTMTIRNALIAGNIAADGTNPSGGGLWVSAPSPVIVDNTTITKNRTVGQSGRGGAIAQTGSGNLSLTLQNGTQVADNTGSGQYSQGGGIYRSSGGTLTVSDTTVSGNRVSGTGAQTGGVYNLGTGVTFTNTAISGNTSPNAPAPGGLYTNNAITDGGGNSVTGNIPTNCTFSPVIPAFCTLP
ncbi:hypothetical protein [Streptomyces sp. NPDC002889]|uniref:hypothetical protein n=1 Tax=Streptomyces sp. NPDC002889 TaxID=3364669 RepID=UPI0036A1B515